MKFLKPSHFRQTSDCSNGKDNDRFNNAEPSGPESERTVYVHNLPPSATWQGVNEIFRQVGTVIRSVVETSESNLRSRVVLASPHEAHQAIVELGDSVWDGHTLHVTSVPFTGVQQVGPFSSAAFTANNFSSSSAAPFPNPDFRYIPPYAFRYIDNVRIKTLEQECINLYREKLQLMELLRTYRKPLSGIKTLFSSGQQRELARRRQQAEQEEYEDVVLRLQELESQQQQQQLLQQQRLQFHQMQVQLVSAVRQIQQQSTQQMQQLHQAYFTQAQNLTAIAERVESLQQQLLQPPEYFAHQGSPAQQDQEQQPQQRQQRQQQPQLQPLQQPAQLAQHAVPSQQGQQPQIPQLPTYQQLQPTQP
ncbi:hypothetical protein HDU79_011531 [Rhizoclosmatium sp. JEL0117]|nr:hypothetical protein HDU79_011531 [Rhizoclosmatium sp. JEL0117]